ncbi:unnamed protein product [Gongylonema pulchrum]|uniref:Ovate family protein n=1 Tax=Gongylonema pulchrum TaxID=637853 RepID=A0A183EF68_9BILA|nr:unnamed protein product [Gongylonema pulchrum]
MLAVWVITSSKLDDRHSYWKDFVEAKTICEKLTEDDSTDSLSILNDLLLSLLSRTDRFHRSVVHFVFASFIPRMKLKNILHIFETINLSDEDIMHEKENSSSDDEDGGESSEAEQPEQNISNKGFFLFYHGSNNSAVDW